MPIVFRSPDERDEYIATQKATVERIIIHSANRIENLIQKRSQIGPYGHLYDLDDIADEYGIDIHTIEPTC